MVETEVLHKKFGAQKTKELQGNNNNNNNKITSHNYYSGLGY
jgi:hypothetical protein